MVEHDLDIANGILHLRPKSSLEKSDFEQLAALIDPYIASVGGLAGLIIETPTFPGWDSLGAMMSHLRFVKDHHQQIKKVAVVTDSFLGGLAEHLAAHFVAAEIRHFPATDAEAAQQWILAPA